MAKKKARQTTQIVFYVISAIVALSMVISMVGPIMFSSRPRPTPTWPPTWTPWPTSTDAPPTVADAGPTPTAVPATPTAAPPTATAAEPTFDSSPPTATAAEEVDVGPPAPVVFAVLGDSRDGDAVYQQLLKRVVADGCQFLVHVGDMVSEGTAGNMAAFQALMADFPLPFYPVPGNHDLDRDGSLAPYLTFTGAPAAHYSLDVETVHLTMANSASGSLSDEELAWIDADLAATSQPVKMVFVHHPPFDPDGTAYVTAEGSEAFLALMEKHGVNYVFSGDIHAYGEQERNGTVYVVSGGGGAPLYSADHPAAFYHYVQVTVLGDQVRTQVVRLD